MTSLFQKESPKAMEQTEKLKFNISSTVSSIFSIPLGLAHLIIANYRSNAIDSNYCST